MRWGLWAILMIGLLPVTTTKGASAYYFAERFEVSAEIAEDGSMRVEENVTFYFAGGSPDIVSIDLPVDLGDRIVDIEAGFNGRNLPKGTGPGHVEVVWGHMPRVRWHMERIYDQPLPFHLSYTVLNGAWHGTGRSDVWWRPLPKVSDYLIREGQIRLKYPKAWAETGAPDVIQGSGRLTRRPGELLFETDNLRESEPDIIVVMPKELATRSSRGQEGQATNSESVRQAKQDSRSWMWTWPSAIVLFGGLYLTAAFRLDERRPPADMRQRVVVTPPSRLDPALAGALRRGTVEVTPHLVLAELFHLAGQGYLAIDQVPTLRESGRSFVIRLKAEPFEPRPYEAELVDLLLNDKNGRRKASVTLSSLRSYARKEEWHAWARSVESELILQGLLKPGRQQRRKRILNRSLILAGLSVAVGMVGILFYDAFGRWPFYLMATLLAQFVLWRANGARISVMSDEGARQAAKWDAFHNYLEEVCWGDEYVICDDDFEAYLPYAAAFGLLSSWTKSFKWRGWTVVPSYFRPQSLDAANQMNAFVTMTSAAADLM